MINEATSFPLREAFSSSEVYNAGMPKDLCDLIGEYVPEFQTKVPPVTLTFWETVRKIVLCILTLGIWWVYQTSKYEAILSKSVDGSGIPDAIKAIKWGGEGQKWHLQDLRTKKSYKEYEFAFAQYAYTGDYHLDYGYLPNDLFDFSSSLKDKNIWNIEAKHKGNDEFELQLFRSYIHFLTPYYYSPTNNLTEDNFELLDERFHEFWPRLDLDTVRSILTNVIVSNNIKLVAKILSYVSNAHPSLFTTGYYDVNPIDRAISYKRYEILELFIATNRAIRQSDFDYAVQNRNINAVRILLKRPTICVTDEHIKAEILREDRELLTLLIRRHPWPLKVAIQLRDLEAIKWLLSQGIKPNINDILSVKKRNDFQLLEVLLPHAPKSEELTQILDDGIREVSQLLDTFQSLRHSLEGETKESMCSEA